MRDLGPQHEILERCLAGNWKSATTIWPAPGQIPSRSTGEMRSEMILGGRFLQQAYASFGPFGEFEGRGVLGYNPGSGAFEYLWMDNMSPAFQAEYGRTEVDWRTMVLNGRTLFPGAKTPLDHRSIWQIRTDDEHLYQRYVKEEGKTMHLQLEIVYTRV